MGTSYGLSFFIQMKTDILVISAHPDDAELSCGGTILAQIAAGNTVGMIDLTRGEMGTRGNPELRLQEAAAAANILGVKYRENLGFRDGFFLNDETHQMEIIRIIRKYRPGIILSNAVSDRHVDHGRAAQLVKDSCFLAGLQKVETFEDNQLQQAWRPQALYHYIQSYFMMPDFVVDVSDFWPKKMEAIKAFGSQFFDPVSREPETFISKPGFMEFIESRGRELGMHIGVTYGEGFVKNRYLGVKNLFNLV
jgi:bacillithiol biosynthesis deacetylase BshB1